MGTLNQGLHPPFASDSGTTFQMDATTDFVAFRFLALSTDPIVKFEVWFTNKTGTPGDFNCVITAENEDDPNISGGVPVDIGGGSPTLVAVSEASISSGARTTVTFTNSFTPTAGTRYWIVMYPGTGTWNSGNRVTVRITYTSFGTDYGDEQVSSSTNTGTSWTHTNQSCYFSVLTTADAYLPLNASCCFEALPSNVAWSDATNPDERGTAMTIPANTGVKVWGAQVRLLVSAETADFALNCYLGDSLQGSGRSIDTSALDGTATSTRAAAIAMASPPITVESAGTLRVAVKAGHASATMTLAILEFGTQARRESVRMFKDMWYCHQNAGGGFTDDKTRLYSILPVAEFYGTGGGSGPIPRFGQHSDGPTFRGAA